MNPLIIIALDVVVCAVLVYGIYRVLYVQRSSTQHRPGRQPNELPGHEKNGQ